MTAATSRTAAAAQEHVLVILRQVVNESRLVDVEIPSFDNIPERLYPDRVPDPFRLHSP